VKLLYCFQNDEHLFFVMEYMEGGDCLSLISSMKRLPEHVAQHFVAQVCVALQHLHQHGVIHRDIKPDNVMVSIHLVQHQRVYKHGSTVTHSLRGPD
jgi:serine/threonine protein kinase